MPFQLPQSRRRSTTLSVCSTVIARVIGRGGANINAIREATGASIEVEKQSAVRRDQHDRQICIRGTQETVR
ncbi:KH domain protein [Cooperia oncophora]